VHQILAGRRDTLYVATATGLLYSVKDALETAPVALVGRPVTALTLDARGRVWYLAPVTGGVAYRSITGGEERTVPAPAVGLALNSQGQIWLVDPRGGFVVVSEAAAR
jgi:hypothetical protein